jgi:Ca2+/Na+ antiporter
MENRSAFRFCKPKYQWLWCSLILAGGLLIVGSEYLSPNASDWIAELGICSTCAGLVVFGVGTIGARRDWQAQRQAKSK